MNEKQIQIAPTEWEIMEVLWKETPLSAAEIFERLNPDTQWNVKTVRAFLDRLIKKNAVSRYKIHGIYVFEPVVAHSKCLRQESRSFLERFFRGNPVSMISHFIEEENLSEKDIARLQQILEKAENKNQSDSREEQ